MPSVHIRILAAVAAAVALPISAADGAFRNLTSQQSTVGTGGLTVHGAVKCNGPLTSDATTILVNRNVVVTGSLAGGNNTIALNDGQLYCNKRLHLAGPDLLAVMTRNGLVVSKS